VPSSWDGRRALEHALLFAAAVPLRASVDDAAASLPPRDPPDSGDPRDTAVLASEDAELHRTTDTTDVSSATIYLEDNENAQQWASSRTVGTDI